MIKKLFTNFLFISFLIFYFINSGIASELYYIKNANKDNLYAQMQNTFKINGYTIKHKEPLFGERGEDNAVVIIQSSQNDLYFYNSASDNSMTKKLKKAIKDTDVSYKRIWDKGLISAFDTQANKIKIEINANKNKAKVYNFDAVESNNTGIITNKAEGNQNTDSLRGYVGQIPIGTTFDVYLQSTINTATAKKNDKVRAILTRNWVYEGNVIAEQGSVVEGYVTKSRSSGMAYRNGYVNLNFNKLITVQNKEYQISTEDIEFRVDSEGKLSDTTKRALTGAAIGAISGLLYGALDRDKSIGKSTAITAGAGAVVGLATAAFEQGVDAEIPIYTEMTLKLILPLSVVLSY